MSTRHAMSHADAAWLHMDRPTNLMVINSVLWFDEPVDWRRCRAVFCERIVDRFDRFRQRAVDGVTGAHWEDVDELDLDLHFHHLALPAPGDRQALQALVGDRASKPLDRTRPLWEVCFIDGLGDGAAVLVRMHHSIADGIALARVMLTLTDAGDVPDAGFRASPASGSALGAIASRGRSPSSCGASSGRPRCSAAP
jgi:diacylglycerol O-acyltransferase / wax synthase